MTYLASARRTLGVAALVVAAVASPTVVAAQPEASTVPPPRVGWEVGFGVHAGEIHCDDDGNYCDSFTEAGGIDLHVNYFFTPQLGVTADVWPMFHVEDDFDFTHTIAVVGVKYRPVPIIWLQAGVGSAQARVHVEVPIFDDIDRKTDTVPAVMAAAGLELLRSPRFALDVQVRGGIGFYREDENDDGEADIVGRNVSIGAGFTWF